MTFWVFARCFSLKHCNKSVHSVHCFIIRPRQDDWHLCLPYYTKSEMSVTDVVRQAVQNKQHTKEVCSAMFFLLCVWLRHAK